MAKAAKVSKVELEETATAATSTAVIPTIKASAMSTDVGPMVISGLATAYDDESKGRELIAGAQAKQYTLLSTLTQGILKAAKADKNIVLGIASGTDPKKQSFLNDQIGIALGFKEVVTVGSGDKQKQRVAYASTVTKFFPMPSDDKNSPEYKRKATTRSNFLHMLKKCQQAAEGILMANMDAKMDKVSGTLLLSGPGVKKQFGVESVLLNEKQTVTDKKGVETKLTEKPSFTALAAKAKEAHGAPIHRGSNTRGAGAQLSNPSEALSALCKSVTDMLARVKEPKKAQIEAVKSLDSAIETWLMNWDK